MDRREEFLGISHSTLAYLLARSYDYIDRQYDEYLCLLSFMARMACASDYICGLYPLREDERIARDWNTALVIDTPTGQLSFLLPDSALPSFRLIPRYYGRWQGMSDAKRQRYLLLLPRTASLRDDQPTEAIPSWFPPAIRS